MKISRRVVLGGMLSAGIATGAYVGFGWARSVNSGNKQPLKIPDINDGNLVNGVRNFDLNLQKGMSQFIEGVHTPTYGINGDYLGPTLKFKANENIKLNVTNNIGRKSTLHWYGMHSS